MSLPKCFLEQKVAIVTGASAGIGRQVAIALGNAGVNLVLAARRAERLTEVRDEIIERCGVKVLAVPSDVARVADLEQLVRLTLEEHGAIHILVNNAGVEAFSHLHELTTADIARTVQTNLVGALQLTALVLPHMLPQRWGHVINMASTAGKHGPPYAAVYAATKAGLIAATQSLRVEYRSSGIRATAVCPGFTVEGGIYDRIESLLRRPTPRVIGSTTAEAVARATVRAIRKDQPEVIINQPPMRPFFTLAAACPRLAEYLLRKFAARYFRLVANTRPTRCVDFDDSNRDAA